MLVKNLFMPMHLRRIKISDLKLTNNVMKSNFYFDFNFTVFM